MPRKAKTVETEAKFDYYGFLNETLDDVSSRLNYDSDPLESATPMSTGLLVLDLLYGGGIRPGWYTHFGAEQSSKTTGTLVIAASALKQNVPFISYSDFEGSSSNSVPYIQSILKTVGIDKTVGEIFGNKDPDTGKWINPPMIRFHAESVGDHFFDFLSSVLRELPDKRQINGDWWLVYEDNKKNKARVGEFVDPSMPKKYGKGLWVRAENGELQAIFIVDSYPAMNPKSNDEDESDNSLALQARMFSKNLPRVKGRLMQKMVAVIGTNQLRAVPMAMFGPKETEPCGTALKYNSDVRCKFTPRSSGQPFNPKNFDKESGWEIEKSVEYEKGTDGYRYIHLKTVKNKLSAPNRIGWLRIWAKDGGGNARGYDPFFDTAYYLKLTGQIVGNRKKLKLKLNNTDIEPTIDWATLKLWVLGTNQQKKDICTNLGYKKAFCLRKYCFNQIRKGIGEKLYIENSQGEDVEESE